MIDRSQRDAARIFGIAYLFTLVLIMVAFSRFYAPFLVWNKDVETARNFIAHESAFRIYLALAVLYGIGSIVLFAALYAILKPIGRGLALFAVFLRLVYVILWYIQLLDSFEALRILGSAPYLHVFEPERLQALAGLRLASGWDAYYIGLPLYAMASLLFNYLFFRARYIPRGLALYGILSALFEGFCGFTYLIDRNFNNLVSVNWYEMPDVLFGVLLSLWLLIGGLRPPDTLKSVQASA